MNIDPYGFDNGPDMTDEGIDIVTHAHHGDGCPIVEIAGIPHSQLVQVPVIHVEGLRFVLTDIDEDTGCMIFRQAEFIADEAVSPPTPSDYDDGFGITAVDEEPQGTTTPSNTAGDGQP